MQKDKFNKENDVIYGDNNKIKVDIKDRVGELKQAVKQTEHEN